MIKYISVFLLFVSIQVLSQSEENPFEVEIKAFEKKDSQNGYQEDFVLFTGSSSIRLWENLEDDMKGINVLNRGFGGAKLSDLNLFWDRILADHKPDLVVLYCGENDINDGISVDDTFAEFKEFQRKYKKDLKGIPLIYVSMKPSISRWEHWENFEAANKKIKRAVWWRSKQKYLDISASMLMEDGTPKPEIFVSDELHMNQAGYDGWKAVLKPIIERELAR